KQLFADTELATARLGGGIKATSPEGSVTAARATWNWRDGRVFAQDKVTISHEKTTLTGAKLTADTNGAHGELSGGVRAVAPEGKAAAGRVIYDWGKNTLSVRDAV